MRVLVAGATGAIGVQLVPRLVDAGHEVTAMIRREYDKARVSHMGAVPVMANALDRPSVVAAVRTAAPEVTIHQLTAIAEIDTRHFERSFATTNHLRTEGTDNLLAAAREAGVERFIVQSNGAFTYDRTGGAIKTEQDPLDRSPIADMRAMITAINHLEDAVLGATWTEGIVLRYGAFYGPGTSMAPGSGQFAMIRDGKFPIVGDGGAVWSSSTSPTPPRRRWSPSIAASAGSTTSSTTTRRRSLYGCPSSRGDWAPRSRCASRGSSDDWRPARPVSCS